MENQTSFDLNEAIGRWRKQLSKSPAFRADDLEELELHVRDAAKNLRAQGLNDEEAFLISVRRTGSGNVLAEEFAVINGYEVLLDRVLWMTIGWITISALLSVILMATVRIPSAFFAPAWPPVVLASAVIAGLRSILPKHLRAPMGWAAGLLIVSIAVLVYLVPPLQDVSGSIEGFSYLIYNVTFMVQCLVSAGLIALVTFKQFRRS